MQTVGDRLRYVRNLRGWTQDELAKASLVSRGVIGNLETGRASTQKVYVEAFSRALNVNFEWLLNGNGLMEVDNERARILDELYQEIV